MTTAPASRSTFVASAPLRVLIVVGASLVVGALTRLGELVLPDAVESAANSTAPWALATFAMVALAGLGIRGSVLLGAASFVAMDLAFYAAFVVTGAYYPRSFLLFWVIVALVAGPLVGLVAAWLRRAGIRRAIAIGSIPAIFFGEGAYIAIRLPDDGRVYPALLVVAGAVILCMLLLRMRPRHVEAVAAVAIALGGAALFALAYNLVPLVIGKVVP
jgi:hypothetical protein